MVARESLGLSEDQLHTGILAFEHFGEVLRLVLLEEVLNHDFHVHPLVLVELVGEQVLVFLFVQIVGAQHLKEYLIELLLDAGHREVGIVFGLVHGVAWSAAIEEVLALLVIPEADVSHPEHALAEEDQVVDCDVLVQVWLFLELRRLRFLMDRKENPCHSHQRVNIVEHQVVGGLLREGLQLMRSS